MNRHQQLLSRLAHVVHQRSLWFVVASYCLAAIIPSPGLWMRQVSFGTITLVQHLVAGVVAHWLRRRGTVT
jgi:BASS family bile acid:Na+ symporter